MLVALVEVTGLSLHKVSEDLHVVGLRFRGNVVSVRGKVREHMHIPDRTAGDLLGRVIKDSSVTKY